MALCWTDAGMLEAERQFRRIIGYQQLATLALAIERDLAPPMTTKEVVISARQRNTSCRLRVMKGLRCGGSAGSTLVNA